MLRRSTVRLCNSPSWFVGGSSWAVSAWLGSVRHSWSHSACCEQLQQLDSIPTERRALGEGVRCHFGHVMKPLISGQLWRGWVSGAARRNCLLFLLRNVGSSSCQAGQEHGGWDVFVRRVPLTWGSASPAQLLWHTAPLLLQCLNLVPPAPSVSGPCREALAMRVSDQISRVSIRFAVRAGRRRNVADANLPPNLTNRSLWSHIQGTPLWGCWGPLGSSDPAANV